MLLVISCIIHLSNIGCEMGNVLYFAKCTTLADFESVDILSIDFNEKNPDEVYKTIDKCYFKFSCEMTIGNTQYRKYLCRFAYKENVIGYIEGSRITELTRVKEFEAFSPVGTSIIFFFIKTNLGKKYIKLINQKSKQDMFAEIEINFHTLITKVKNVMGGWFKIDGIKIKAQSIVGYDIADDPEFVRLRDKGSFSSLQIEYFSSQYNLTVSPIISKKNSIFIIERTTKDIALEISYKLYLELLI